MEEDATRLSPLARNVDQRSVHTQQAGIASRSQAEDLTLSCVLVTAWQVVIAMRLRVGANRGHLVHVRNEDRKLLSHGVCPVYSVLLTIKQIK